MKINFINLQREFKTYQNQLTKLFLQNAKKGNYVLGEELSDFEKNVAKYLNVKYAIGVGNWTTGMGMVLKAYNILKDDEVITVSHSFIATAGAIAYHGSKPVLVDIKDNFNIDEDKIISKITKKTKAVMPVHLTGMPCEMDKIKKICNRYNLILIEDAAQAFGSKYKGKNIGAIGNVGIFSLHPRKNLHVLGDGGLITTNDFDLMSKIKVLRNQGLQNRDSSNVWGTNSRLDNIQASFGNFFLKKISQINNSHRKIADYYNKNITDKVIKPTYNANLIEPTFQNYAIRSNHRDELRSYLDKKGVETSIHYPIPIHQQKVFIKQYGKVSLPKTEEICSQIISLPIYHTLKMEEKKYIVNSINSFYK